MTITRSEATVALRMLGAAFPAYPVDQDTVEVYLQKLTAPPVENLPTLYAALSDWIDREDRFPTVHQVLTAYASEASTRARLARAAEQDRAAQHGLLAGMPPASARYSVEMVDVIRTAWEGRPVRQHKNHQRGRDPRETCPTCMQADDVADALTDRVRGLLEVRGIVPPRVGQVTYACRECEDHEWVLGEQVVHPCPSCRPDTHRRWEEGHYAPGHTCKECDDVAKGKTPAHA